MAEWKYRFENHEFGPFGAARMRHFARLGVIHADTEVWRSGMLGWAPYKTLAHEIETSAAPPPSTPDVRADEPESQAPDAAGADPFGIDPQDEPAQPADLTDIRIDLPEVDYRDGGDPWWVEPATEDGDWESPPRRNYVARHWRGELSFWVSCWVNGLLPLLLVGAGLVYMMRHGIVLSPQPQVIVPLVVIGVCLGLWQIVGIWRAAGRSLA